MFKKSPLYKKPGGIVSDVDEGTPAQELSANISTIAARLVSRNLFMLITRNPIFSE